MPQAPPTLDDFPDLAVVYGRNIDFQLFKRNWSPTKICKTINISESALTRLRHGRARYIDPEVLLSLLRLFECTPNDLLLPHPGIDYTNGAD